MQLSLLQGFGINQYTGNKALIITEHELNAKQKQDFARKQNLPVSIFVDDDSAGNFTVDFYYPHRQSPMCLHGSLAAAKMYFNQKPRRKQRGMLGQTVLENIWLNHPSM